MKKLFIFDVDDVIYDLKHTIQNALKIETGKDIHSDDWYSFNLADVYDVDMKIIFDSFHEHDILRNGVLNFDIYKVIDYLKKSDIETLALTARGWHPEGDEITKMFFKANEIEIDNIKVIQHHESKAEFINKLKDYDILGYVDDNSSHIHNTNLLVGDKVNSYFLKNQPWNKNYNAEELKGIQRIDSILDINDKIESILSINPQKRNKIRNLP